MSPSQAQARPRRRTLVDGEFPFTEDDFFRIASILHADAGIALQDAKATLVYSRLAKRLRALGLESFRDYCALIADGEAGVGERRHMLAALTTNVTRFFREPHHFEHLKTKVLPSLLARARAGGRVRLWSAGCSAGHEPYSMALTVLSLEPQAADFDIRILATDIDTTVLAQGRRGVYDAAAAAPIPADLRARWMDSAPQGAWSAGDAMRRLVAFRELNLIGPWPIKGLFDVIFCRNVVIYFEDASQARIWERFRPALAPEGRLYIGHSERMDGPAASAFVSDGLTTYRLARAGAA
jgi:chemotaxis protein methyltransferase CheR